jgi:hypothetical protein
MLIFLDSSILFYVSIGCFFFTDELCSIVSHISVDMQMSYFLFIQFENKAIINVLFISSIGKDWVVWRCTCNFYKKALSCFHILSHGTFPLTRYKHSLPSSRPHVQYPTLAMASLLSAGHVGGCILLCLWCSCLLRSLAHWSLMSCVDFSYILNTCLLSDILGNILPQYMLASLFSKQDLSKNRLVHFFSLIFSSINCT